MSESPALKKRKPRGKPNAIDVHVGIRARLRRMLMGLSQEALASAMDVSFQQVQKYENGTNRIGAARLYELARALDVPVGYFFDEMPEEITNGSYKLLPDPLPSSSDDASFAVRETMLMVRAYYGIEDPAVRRRMLDLMRVMANGEDVGSE